MSRLISLMFLTAFAAFSQTAQMTGMVTDPSGTAVPGASVSARNTETGINSQVATNEQGYYTITHLNPGTYELTVQKQGFRAASRPEIKLDVAQIARIDVALVIGEIKDTVTVT